MPQLELVLQGINRELAGRPAKSRLPITPAILRSIRAGWDHSKEWDHMILWAAMCLCFFDFLHAGEAVAPDNSEFDPTQHLTYADIAVDSMPKPNYSISK